MMILGKTAYYLFPHIKVYLGVISGMNVTFWLFSRNLSLVSSVVNTNEDGSVLDSKKTT